MRRFALPLSVLGLTAILGLMVGCEWDSGGEFNTSQGAGANVNFSGVYTARSGDLVEGRGVNRLLITQTGNSIQVQDESGAVYEGNIGSPGVVANGGVSYPIGATMLQSQISFSGNGVQFVGVIRAVAADEVFGFSESSSESSTNATELIITEDDGDEEFTVISGSSEGESTSSFYSYTITEANTQYVLEGNWMEGGAVWPVDGYTHALTGSFATP